MTELEKNLEIDMIPGEVNQTIASEIGMENFLKLTKIAGGRTLYLPLYQNTIKPARDKMIKSQYNGYNSLELAKKYDLTERRVMQIVGGDLMSGQCSMFEND